MHEGSAALCFGVRQNRRKSARTSAARPEGIFDGQEILFSFLVGLKNWMMVLIDARASSLTGSLAFTLIQQKSPKLLRILSLWLNIGEELKKNPSKTLPSSKDEHPKAHSLSHKPFLLVEHYQLLDLG